MTRKDILDTAAQCVCYDREDQYGTPEDNFTLIGNLWGEYLRASTKTMLGDIAPEDVAIMLALVKVARIATGKPKADNYVDLAGYAACGGEIATRGAVEDGQG